MNERHPYFNDADQSEKRKALENDLRIGGTYHQFATGDASEEGGRYAKQMPSHVVGSTQIPNYPGTVPAWVQDRGPDEPPLGFSVEAQEPVGETFEIEKSLDNSSLANGRVQEGAAASLRRPPSNNSSSVATATAEGATRRFRQLPPSRTASPTNKFRRI